MSNFINFIKKKAFLLSDYNIYKKIFQYFSTTFLSIITKSINTCNFQYVRSRKIIYFVNKDFEIGKLSLNYNIFLLFMVK